MARNQTNIELDIEQSQRAIERERLMQDAFRYYLANHARTLTADEIARLGNAIESSIGSQDYHKRKIADCEEEMKATEVNA